MRTLAANERRWQDILAKTDGGTMILHCQSILFDLDGVLIDSCAVTERHLQAWAQRHGVELAQLLALHHGRTTVETLRAVAPHLNAETEARELESAEERDLEGLRAFPGASRLLAELERQPWAIVTSCKRTTASARLAQLGLPLPAVLITAEDVRQGKPAPEPYLLAAQRLGLPPSSCVVIEDAPAGITSARAAGARVIAVASSLPEAALAAADQLVRQLDELQIQQAPHGLSISLRAAGTTLGALPPRSPAGHHTG